jgi:hypothetical protein
MKKLYALVSNCGDGSYAINFTMNEKWVKTQEDLPEEEVDYEYGIGRDGDGFSYSTLTVPDECTLESLGIHYDCGVGE